MTAADSAQLIGVEGLTVSRNGQEVLSQLNFTIKQGECVAIAGPNGAGKTTLMLTLLGLLPATGGRIFLKGKLLAEMGGRRAIAKLIAYVPQHYEGFEGFTVYDMVAAGRYAHLGPLALHRTEDLQIIDQALTASGLTSLQNRIVANLSGGERQKVFLAAALTQQSPVLFLDEPTTALDPKHHAELATMLQKLLRLGKTLLIICHDLNLPAALNARILALRKGRLVFDGAGKDFYRDQQLHQVFDTSFECLETSRGQTKIFPNI